MSQGGREAKLSYLNIGLKHLPIIESERRGGVSMHRLILLRGFPSLLFFVAGFFLYLALQGSEMTLVWGIASAISLCLVLLFVALEVRRVKLFRARHKFPAGSRDYAKLHVPDPYLGKNSKLTSSRDPVEDWRETARAQGSRIGKRLALDYRKVSELKSPEESPIALYELIPDLEKDLNPSFLSKKIPQDQWSGLVQSLGEEAAVTLVKQAAIESFLRMASDWEKSESISMPEKRSKARGITKTLRTKPGIRLHLDPTEFESYCVEWSHYLGYLDASVTRSTKDGGIDISSSSMVAQCKYQELPVGVKPIRELFGISQALKKKPLFFALNGYTREAVNEAEQFGVELWIVRPLEGEIHRVGLGEVMNQGDYHSGPEGYSPNTAYPETQYGSNFDEEADWNK